MKRSLIPGFSSARVQTHVMKSETPTTIAQIKKALQKLFAISEMIPPQLLTLLSPLTGELDLDDEGDNAKVEGTS